MPVTRFLSLVLYMGIISLFTLAGCKVTQETHNKDDQLAIEETRTRVFTAYKAGDLETMMAYFHPDVIQIPSYDKLLIGKERVQANYAAALSMFDIVISDDLEDMHIDGDVATTHGLYTVTLTPKAGGEPMQRSGRYMVIMKRWAGSPTGWSTFRELVQPAA